jgi:hypothetical protein
MTPFVVFASMVIPYGINDKNDRDFDFSRSTLCMNTFSLPMLYFTPEPKASTMLAALFFWTK